MDPLSQWKSEATLQDDGEISQPSKHKPYRKTLSLPSCVSSLLLTLLPHSQHF